MFQSQFVGLILFLFRGLKLYNIDFPPQYYSLTCIMFFHALVFRNLEYSALCLSNQLNFGAFFEVCVLVSSCQTIEESVKQ